MLAEVTCTRRPLDLLPDILGPAGSGTEAFDPITITVRTPSDLPDGTVISNTASVEGKTYEDPADIARDNTSTDEVAVITRADLRIVKQLTTNLIAGDEANYSLAVTNLGPSTSRATAADPITVVDTLPAGARFVSVDGGPTWACRHDGSALGGIVTCDRDTDLPASPLPGSSARIINVRIEVPSGATGAFVNTAEVALGPDNLPITTDPVPGNNRSITTTIIGTDADLAIEKEWLGPAVPGEPTVYQIKVDNLGPSDALSIVRITDTLPAGLTYRSSSNVAGSWTCAATADGFTCDLSGPLASQASATVQIEVDVAPSVIGVVNNTARVDSTTTPDTRQANNETIEPATFVGSADLSITKTSNGPAVPGGPISWTIGVRNLGPSDSVGPITVTDVLPAGVLGPVVAAGTGWDCTGTVGTTVSCVRAAALSGVAPGETAPPITVTAVADPASPGPDPIVNTASVVGTTADGNDTNNSSSSQTNVIEPNVTLDKRVDDLTPEPGDTFTYTLDLTNETGPDVTAAYNLVVTDVVPTGVVVDEATISNGGTLVGDTITWNIPGPLAVGATLAPPLSYEASLAPSADIDRTPLVNTATLNSYESLPTGGRTYSGNSDTATVTPQFPRLFTEKAVVQDVPAFIGDPFGWEITVTNTGDGTAFDVAVIDTLPTNWLYVPGSTVITRPAGQPTLTDDPAILNGVATWAPLGALAPGESLTVAFRATPTTAVAQDPGVGSDVDQVNTARSTAEDATDATSSGAGDYGSDPATAVAIIEAADVIIDKSPNGTAVAGSTFDWTLTVTNNTGVDTAVGPFVVTDTLPPEVSYVSAVGDGWSCTESAGTVTCNRTNAADVLASPGGFPAITVTVAIPSDFEGDLTNTASVTSRTADLDLTNNSDIDVVTVVGVADLGIVKNRTNSVILAGTPTTYTLDVTNFGPSTSRADIVVTDTLPPEVTFVSAPELPTSPADPWDCVHNGVNPGGVVTCTLADPSFNSLLINQSAPSIVIEVDVAANADPDVDIINRARVDGTTTDPNPVNDTASNTGRPDVSADLVINKQVDAGGLIAGEEATYQLRVFNIGPSDAQSVVITDDLPDTLTYVSFASSTAAGVFGTWSCTPAADNGSFTCDLDTPLPPNRFAIVDVTVLVAEGVTDPVVNSATVTSPTPDPNLGNNTDSDTVAFDAQADLSVLKTRPAAPVIAGERVTWTLTVTNNGPSTSQPNIVVSDPLPDSVEFVSATGDGWVCTTAPAGTVGFSDTVTCTRATALLAATAGDANVAPPITIEADVLPTAGPGVIVNTATVKGETFDPDPTNDSSTNVVPVIDRADVQVVKAPETQTVRAGENATFTLTVTNNGPSTADSVVIADVLPSGMTVISASGSTSSCVTPTPVSIQCALGALDPFDPGATPPGPTEVVTVVAKVGSGVVDGAELVNLATVSTSTTDTNPSNNSDTATVQVVSEADLAIAKSHPVDPVVAGDPMTFEIVVSNLGPSDALGPIEVTDTLPRGFRYLSVTGPWACTPRPGTAPQIVDCTLRSGGTDLGLVGGTPSAPTVAPSMFMTVQLDPSLDPSDTAGTYDNLAVVDYPTDPNDTNNTATDPVNVVTSVNISIEKTHDPDEVRIGENLRFALAVTNEGPSEARNIVVRDTLPTGLTLVSVAGLIEPSSWDCSETSAPDVVCRLAAPLPPGADAERIIVTALVEPTAFPKVANTAVVSTTTTETDPSDNVSTDVVAVPRLVDLFIEKKHTGPVVVGGEILYSLTVGNNGPIDDDGIVTVVDDVPAGLRVTEATSILANCDVSGQRVTCTKADGLAVGDTFLIFIRADVLPAAYPSVTNTATVSSPTDDSNPLNNNASDVATVPPLVDLAITKTHTGEVQVGGQITYTVTVRNNGPTPDPGPVRMLDTLPGSLTPVSATADGMTCTITGPTVACQALAPLAVDAQLVITIVADVGAGAFPSVSNTATVTTPGCVVGPAARDAACPDTNLDNNTATDVAMVAPLVDLAVTKTHAGSVQVGGQITYTVTVRNNGPTPDPGPVRMLDTLPGSLTPVSATAEGMNCAITGQTVACQALAPLAVGAQLVVTIVADVGPGAFPSVSNTATVSSPAEDVNVSNNSATDVAMVAPLVDLAVTKTHAGSVQVGGQITYTVTVRNNGPTPDPGPVRMLDTLPGSLTPVSATAEGMNCAITGQTVACQALAPLAVGAQLVVTIVADVGPGAFPSVSNTAIVTTPGCVVGPAARDAACPDTNLDNNTATDVATVAPLVLLGVQKTLASLEASTATWSIVVTNLGSNTTVDPIRMTDNLPSTLAYVSAGGDGWLCTNIGQVVGCTYSGPLAPGASTPPISVVTLVNAPAGTSITNVATVDGGGPGVPSVTDDGNVIAPVRPPLPTTGGDPGVLLQWAPLLMLLGLALVIAAKRRRTNHAS